MYSNGHNKCQQPDSEMTDYFQFYQRLFWSREMKKPTSSPPGSANNSNDFFQMVVLNEECKLHH